MNILFIKIFFVGFMVSEIPRVAVFEHCPTDSVRIYLILGYFPIRHFHYSGNQWETYE